MARIKKFKLKIALKLTEKYLRLLFTQLCLCILALVVEIRRYTNVTLTENVSGVKILIKMSFTLSVIVNSTIYLFI